MMHDILIRQISDGFNDLRIRGYVHEWRIRSDINCDATLLDVVLTHGESRSYDITGLEMLNEGDPGYWFDTVKRDIIYRCDRIRQEGSQQYNQFAAMAQQQQFYNDAAMQAVLTEASVQQYRRQLDQRMGWAPENEAAQKRAEELFLMICGKKAFDTLKSGKPLPITGSQGTKYKLHKRASYCVERVSDNERLCAVVPGVPVFDHLLGIKLMVEHEEEHFLKIANIAVGDTHETRTRPQNRNFHYV